MHSDIPIWVYLAMFVGFMVFFFSAPEVMDESYRTVVFRKIPYVWLLVPCALHLFLCSLGLKIYEWADFGDDDRRLVLGRVAVLAAVEVCSWYGGMLLCALLAWSYDDAIIIAIVPPTLLLIYWRFIEPRLQLRQ